MNTLFTIRFLHKKVTFGEPSNDEELNLMYALRHKIYCQRNYISVQNSGLDIDDYDRCKKCIYVIVKIGTEVIGSARLIVSNPMPTEIYYTFEKPSIIEQIPSAKRAEISRLVVDRTLLPSYIPKHLIMLGILRALVILGKREDLLGGYAFIRGRLLEVTDEFNIKVNRISSYKLIYNDEYLYQYFYGEDSYVIPIFFLRDEVDKSLTLALNKLQKYRFLYIFRLF